MRSHVTWDRLVIMLSLSTLLFFYGNRPCFGQAAAINGQIEGTISDPQGAVVPNAKVEIANVNTGFKRSAQADQTGFYRFTFLPLGSYEVSASAPAFANIKRSGVVLNAGTIATVDLQLALGQVSKAIVVTSDAPVVEPGRTDIGFTLGSALVTNLPLVSRNNFNFILVQPNVSGHPNTELGVPRKINANGFADRVNYQLDGSNNTESDRSGIRLLPISNTWIQEVQDVNNGFAPEFGNTIGTVYNTITKSGTNVWHGEAAYLFRRTNFVARNFLLKPTDVKPTLNLDDGFGDIGGPVIKDKLFIFGSFEKIKRDIPQGVSVAAATIAALGLPASLSQPVPFAQTATFVMAKADYQINSANRLMFRYNYFRNEEPYDAASFGTTLATESFFFHDRAPSYAVQLISAVSPHAVNEFRFQLPRRDELQSPFSGTGPQPVLAISSPPVNFGGSDQTNFHFIEKTPEFSDNFSYNLRSHSLRFGGDIRLIRDDQVAALYAKYTFAGVTDYLAAVNGTNPKSYTNYQQVFGQPEVKYNSTFTGLFVQDDWKVRPNLSVIYGVRYDLFSMPKANPQSLFGASQKFNEDTNNFAPRLGIVYAFGKEQKTVLRVNGGVFFDPPQTDIYRLALLNNGQPQFFTMSVNAAQPFSPAFPTIFTGLPSGFSLPTQDITTIAPGFVNLSSTNFNAQISRQISPNLALNVSYLYTKGNHIPVYFNVNLVPTGAALADGRPLFSSSVHVDPRFNNVIMATAAGNSVYNALNVNMHRRFSKGLDFFASYSWSHAIDDAPERNVLDSSNFGPSDPTNLRRDRGNSLTDRRHVVTASGSWQPGFTMNSKGLQYLANNNRLALFFTGGSGDIFNEGSNRNLNNDQSVAASLQRPLFIGRNTIRGPYIAQVDMRYARIFPIRERWKPEFFAEFTNLFNHSNYTGINSTATVDTQGNILAPPTRAPNASVLDARLMQLGIKLTF